MNILAINWRDSKHPRTGGAELHFHKIFEPLVAQGHKVILISCGFKGGSAHDEINGVKVVRIGNDYTFNFLCMFYLHKWIKEFKVDIVYEAFNKLPFLTPLLTNKPVVVQIYHLWRFSIFKEANFLIAFYVWLGEQSLRFFYHKAKFIVISQSTFDELRAMVGPKAEINLIHCGIEKPSDNDNNNSDPTLISNQPYLFWLGRIQKYKGIQDALQAFKIIHQKHPEFTLKIAGDGPYLDATILLASKLNIIDCVQFLGYISENQKTQLLAHSYLLLQTSYKEGWGLTVIEANLLGATVVANNAPGLRDSVRDRQTGLLYNFGDAKDCAIKINELIENKELYFSLKNAAKPWANSFDWSNASKLTLEILLKTI